MRGLEERLKDLIADDEAAQEALDEAVQAASALAGEGWTQRLGAGPRGPGEVFLAAGLPPCPRPQPDDEAFYSLEAETQPLSRDDAGRRCRHLSRGLKRIADPLAELARLLRKKMDDKTADAGALHQARGWKRRRAAWTAAPRPSCPPGSRCWRRWRTARSPTSSSTGSRSPARTAAMPMSGWNGIGSIPPSRWPAAVLEPAHGALITSATLRDTGGEHDDHWASAEVRTGAGHLAQPARRAHFGSPFQYEDQSRIFVVNDMPRRDPDALAAAYRELFLASGGGALGLFTAVRALRDTGSPHRRSRWPHAGLTLYAQHMDRLDTGALVDLFRAEENACLLGTDALRDGVDVPGRSLRLVVFDKVPWPKPTILHKARRARFGKGYDDLLTRFRLKQAFGRLIRGPEDKGCFVILEGATPSRLLTAFPEKARSSAAAWPRRLGISGPSWAKEP